MKYRSYYSHISICLLSLYFLRPFLSLHTSFTPSLFPVFSLPPFSVSFTIFLTVRRWCLHPQHIFPSFSPLSFPSPLFSLSFFPFLPSLFFLFSFSPCKFLVRRPPPCRTTSDGPGIKTFLLILTKSVEPIFQNAGPIFRHMREHCIW